MYLGYFIFEVFSFGEKELGRIWKGGGVLVKDTGVREAFYC